VLPSRVAAPVVDAVEIGEGGTAPAVEVDVAGLGLIARRRRCAAVGTGSRVGTGTMGAEVAA
jgi:hypothetical protein